MALKDQFKEGDLIWLEATHLPLDIPTTKLVPKYQGPFQILKQILPVAYHLKLPRGWTIHNIFHALLLTPYLKTKQHGTNFTHPPIEIIEGEEEFKV